MIMQPPSVKDIFCQFRLLVHSWYLFVVRIICIVLVADFDFKIHKNVIEWTVVNYKNGSLIRVIP